MAADCPLEINPRTFGISRDTCWVLGAGASHDCLGSGRGTCIPLTRSLLDQQDLPKEIMAPLNVLAEAGGLCIDASLETFGTRIEETIDRIRGLCRHEEPCVSHAATICLREIIRKIAINISWGQTPACLAADGSGTGFSATNYLWLSAMCSLSPHWSVITLNYDTLLDSAFEIAQKGDHASSPVQYLAWRNLIKGIGVGTAVPNRETGLYLKPHGSLEIYSCHNPECSSYRVPFKKGDPDGDIWFSFHMESKEKCEVCGQEAVEFILPPGHHKTWEEGQYQKAMYTHFRDLLSTSDTWLFIGYSCPEYDEDIMTILQEAACHSPSNGQQRVLSIVSPDADSLGRRLHRKLGLPTRAYMETFSAFMDKWVDAIKTQGEKK